MEEENDVCSKCGLVELPIDYPYYHCHSCRDYEDRHSEKKWQTNGRKKAAHFKLNKI